MRRTIETRTTVRAPVSLARRALTDHVVEVFGGSHRQGEPARAFDTTISVELGGGTDVNQTVHIHAGRVHDAEDGAGLVMPVHWVAERDRLCPSFEGELRVLPGDGRRTLELVGAYEVPLGGLGRVGDAAAGRRIAQRSLDQMIVGIGRRLDRAVDSLRPKSGMRSVPEQGADLRAEPRSIARPFPDR